MTSLLPNHSVENMVAEVTLHTNIDMSKNCRKIQKIVQNCQKLKGYLSNYIFHTVPNIIIHSHLEI